MRNEKKETIADIVAEMRQDIAEDKRFNAKERGDLYSFWFNACLDKEWGT